MKLLKYLVAALLLALSACSNDKEAAALPTPTPLSAAAPRVTGPASASASLAILNAYLAAWNEHDGNKAGAFLDEDVQYFDAAFAGAQRGRQAAVEHGIGVFLRGVPDLRWEIRSVPIASADGIAYEWTFTGSNTGTWGGISATNQKINIKGVGFVRIKNGKIVYQGVYYDSGTLNRQLGL